MKIAICQTNIIWEDKKQNLESCRQNVKRAKDCEADVIFFPEMSFTGFSMNIEKTAEDNLHTIEAIMEEAFLSQICIGAGWVKKREERAENHYSVISPQKEIILDYTKIHSFTYAGENQFFIPGSSISYGFIRNVKFSTFICYDLRFPELFMAVDEDTSLIVIPANWPQARSSHWLKLLQARAIENQVFITGINCVGDMGGQYYSGDSCIINPNGEIVKMLSHEEGILTYEVPDNLIDYRKNFPVRDDRRTILYKSLY